MRRRQDLLTSTKVIGMSIGKVVAVDYLGTVVVPSWKRPPHVPGAGPGNSGALRRGLPRKHRKIRGEHWTATTLSPQLQVSAYVNQLISACLCLS